MRRWITELVGTALLVLVYVWAYAYAPGHAPLAIGGALALLIHVSGRRGGHFNPALSVGLMLRGRLGEDEALRRVAAQLAGATAGALVASAALGEGREVAGVYGFDPEAAFFVEALVACALVLVALLWGGDDERPAEPSVGAAQGALVATGLLLGGPISGGAFNPAIGFAPVLAAIGRAPVGHAWIFVVGPLVGAGLAVLTHRALRPAAAALSATSLLVGEGSGRSGEFLDPSSPPVDIVGRIHRRRAGQTRIDGGGRRRR